MTNQENETPSVAEQPATTSTTEEAVKNPSAKVIASLLALKESNPKVFFGGIGGIVLVLLIIIMSGGSESGVVSQSAIKNLVVGQKYVLKSANAYDPAATVRLVSVPGAIAAYDDTEAADRNGVCQNMAQGTQVTVVDLADAYGKKNSYAKVKIEGGDCNGNEGWALAIDVQ